MAACWTCAARSAGRAGCCAGCMWVACLNPVHVGVCRGERVLFGQVVGWDPSWELPVTNPEGSLSVT